MMHDSCDFALRSCHQEAQRPALIMLHASHKENEITDPMYLNLCL